MRRVTLVVVGVIVLQTVSMTGPGLAQDGRFVRGEPELDVFAPEPLLTPGTIEDVSLQVANGGEADGAVDRRALVTTARNVRVSADADDAPFTIETQRQSVGPVPDGEVRDVPITVSVPSDIDPGTYSVDVDLRYAHTSVHAPRSGVAQERTRSVTRTVTLRVAEGPRFELEGVRSDVQIGESGPLDVEVRNAGTGPASDVDIALESTSPYVGFADGVGDTARIDRLEANESATVTYEVSIREGAPVRAYSLDGTVRFTDGEGIRSSESDLSVGVSPIEEQSFEIDVEESTLRVGEPGVIRGSIRNAGPVGAESVTLELGEGQFEPRTGSYAIGDLAVGESAPFEFRATVPRGADAVPQRIDTTTRYRTTSDTDRVSTDPIRVPVADRRDAIAVTAVDPQFAAGESGTLTLELRNQRDVEVRDVRVTLVAEDPLESDFRTTVVPSLSPGETDRVAFDLDVDGDARASRYPATVNVTYTGVTDQPTAVRPTTVAIEVTESGDALPVTELLAGLFVVLLIVGVGWWFYGKRLV